MAESEEDYSRNREDEEAPRYTIDVKGAATKGRSLVALLAGRRCVKCQGQLSKAAQARLDAQRHIKKIVECCSRQPEYLVPEMPLKEALFRLLLANGNRPASAEELQQGLSERWKLLGYPKDLSPWVIQRLLDHDTYYGVTRVSEQQEKVK